MDYFKSMRFNIREIRSLDSTNLYAHNELSRGKLNEGDVIITYNQVNGKGLGSNRWESEPDKNLTLSIIFEPDFIPASRQFALTQFVSLAICDVISSYLKTVTSEPVKIKWPNDIYIGNKKVAGILFQNFIRGNLIEFAIAGIGININQEIFCSDAKNPVSIFHHLKYRIPIDDVLKNLLDNIEKRYEAVRDDINVDYLKAEYMNNLYVFNLLVVYKDIDGQFEGRITDVDEFGRLIIRDKAGKERKYMFKEVELVLPNT
jgi:BirA family transcriptional regulator, biotin operon repressor / biotin---[acetyl-CoA-carboxylase] ligase